MKIDVPIIGEFIRAHGDNPVRKPGSTFTYLLPDGASYRQLDDGTGDHRSYEPSDDPVELCKAKRLYAAIVFEQVRKDLRQLRAALLGVFDANKFRVTFKWPVKRYGPDPEDAATALRMLHTICTERHAKLMQLDRELRELTRPVSQAPVEEGYNDKRINDALQETQLDFIEV